MHSSQWDQVKALFLAALDQPVTERSAYLDRETAGDGVLRENVDSLLESHDAADDFLETPAVALFPEELSDPSPLTARVGAYRLLREIGRGGMGTVYLAARDDGEFRHQVAVKLVKRGMDTDLILARFRHERQILAGLDHPNIARLLDGGTTDDGRPFFVMEFVDGESIRAYCERLHLSVNDRVTLFRTVCAAVQHAHQNLVVHRDIKASNIVVTVAGVPKLLDFGIAKLLDADRSDTGTPATDTVMAMTPEYASPEQIRGDPVTTSTDVYSLGVLLYELLSGHRPFASNGRRSEDVARAVCDTEPPSPSDAVSGPDAIALRRLLHGDLDTIVLMAMRKDPRRRYGSVEQLSEDLRRYLAGRPVSAQRDRLGYRVRKFVRRNRLALSATAVLFVSLVGGLGTAIWQARVARAERTRAERRFGEVRTLATSFLFELHDAIVNLPGATPARALLVKRALTSLDGLSREAQGDPVLQRELAVAYQKVGDVQGNSYNSNLGDTQGAMQSYRKSLQLLERVAGNDSTDQSVQSALTRSYQNLAEMLSTVGDLRGALQTYQRALTVLQRLVDQHPDNARYRSDLATLHNEIGDTQGQEGYANVGDMPGAQKSYRASVALRESLYAAAPTNIEARVGLASSLMNLGYLASTLGDSTGAEQILRAVQLLESVVAEQPNDATRKSDLLAGYARLRQPLADAGRFGEAIAVDQRILIMLGEMIAADGKNTLFRRNLGATYNYLGRDLRASGNARKAIDNHRRALAIAEQLAVGDATSAEHRHDVAFTRFLLAEALADVRDYQAALVQYHIASISKQSLRVTEPSNTRHADDLGSIYAGMGAVLANLHDYAGADAAYRQAVPLAEAAAARNAGNQKAKATLASVYSGVGRLSFGQREVAQTAGAQADRCREATNWFGKSAIIWQAMQKQGTLPVMYASMMTDDAHASAMCVGVLAR